MDTLIYSHIKPVLKSYDIFQFPKNENCRIVSDRLLVRKLEYTEKYPFAQNLYLCNSNIISSKLLQGNDWILFITLFVLVLLTYIKVAFSKVFKNLLISLVNYQIARQLVNEKSGIVQKTSFFLYSLFIFNISLFLFSVAQNFQLSIFSSKLIDFLFIVLFCIVFYSVKVVIYKFIGFLIGKTEETDYFLNHFGIFFKNLGIYLTPFTVTVFYINNQMMIFWLIIIFFIVIIFSLLRIYRAIKLSFQMQYSLFYIFLYLCTVEIVPIIYSIKLLKMWT